MGQITVPVAITDTGAITARRGPIRDGRLPFRFPSYDALLTVDDPMEGNTFLAYLALGGCGVALKNGQFITHFEAGELFLPLDIWSDCTLHPLVEVIRDES